MKRAIGLACCLLIPSCSDETALLGQYHRAGSAGRSDGTAGVAADASESGRGGAGTPGTAGAGVDSGMGMGGGPGTPLGDALVIEPGTRAEFCAGAGPAIRIVSNASPGSPTPICTPALGRRLFRYGLCSCSDVTVSAPGGSFFLDAFDSNHGAYAAGESGAALGIDGSINALGGLSSVSGSAIIAGRESLYVSTSRLFGADLKTNESIDFSLGGGVFSVARDLWSDADIRAGLTSVVGRDVYQTPGRTGAATLTSVGGNAQTRAFAIAPPCACGTDAELDVAALVARARLDNDNDALGLSAAELSSALAQGKIPSGFDCGRFLLGSVSIPSSMLQSIHGRLALFIDGDLTLSGNFASDLGANAELDILVRGDLVVVGQAQIGAIDRPSALRLYIAGSQPIQSTIVLTYAAQIYAPHAAFRATDGTVTGWGAVFAASFETTALYTLHYDRAIVDLGDACTGVPPPRCDGCQQCPSGLACIDGACAACSSDADCCEPFACTNGRCLPLIYTAPKK